VALTSAEQLFLSLHAQSIHSTIFFHAPGSQKMMSGMHCHATRTTSDMSCHASSVRMFGGM